MQKKIARNKQDQTNTHIIKRKEFKVNKMPSKYDKTTRIYLSEEQMLKKWVDEIGFSDPKTISKFIFWKNNKLPSKNKP
ncbi:hypothetical protein K9L97_04150 [Candidatus Woesearchaeota archaeon]|nr:hypothetical protein [Candidatus Woesearchaeota archaeon]